ADDVGAVERPVRPPGAGQGGDVEDDIAADDGTLDGGGGAEVALVLRHAAQGQFRIAITGKAGDVVAARHQQADDGAAQEAAAAGHQRVHASRPAAHAASFSRKILALWRMSTGNFGWKRIVRIALVCACAAPRASNS